jgi:hypothetical protein
MTAVTARETQMATLHCFDTPWRDDCMVVWKRFMAFAQHACTVRCAWTRSDLMLLLPSPPKRPWQNGLGAIVVWPVEWEKIAPSTVQHVLSWVRGCSGGGGLAFGGPAHLSRPCASRGCARLTPHTQTAPPGPDLKRWSSQAAILSGDPSLARVRRIFKLKCTSHSAVRPFSGSSQPIALKFVTVLARYMTCRFMLQSRHLKLRFSQSVSLSSSFIYRRPPSPL